MRLQIALLLLLCSCAKPSEVVAPLFNDGEELGEIDSRIPEASGIASSVAYPGYIWTHNDSGNPAEVFLIDTTAHVKLTCKLPVPNRDWEDIAVGRGPEDGKAYVYVAEIGDNDAKKDTKIIYRFEEPVTDSVEITITKYDTLTIKLEDGKRDTETILIDPLTDDLYIISKREDNVGVYKVPYPFTKGVMTAAKVATIPFHKIVAGSISKDGLEILLKDYDHIYYWTRTAGEPLEKVITGTHKELPYKREAQGESITWSQNGNGYYTLSEVNPSKPSYLRFYRRQ